MKTTVEIPDAHYRQLKARAALEGQTIKDFLVEAVRAKLVSAKPKPSKRKTGWQAAFGTADPKQVAEVQRIWIAALARQHALEIVSQDSHFDHVEGVRRTGW